MFRRFVNSGWHFVGLWLICQVATAQPPPTFRYIAPDSATGSSAAVVMCGATSLYTAQITAPDKDLFEHAGDAEDQAKAVLSQLEEVLGQQPPKSGPRYSILDKSASVERANIVKLNVYVTAAEAVPKVQGVLAKKFVGFRKPAVSYVVTRLPVPGAVVAMDAVAAGSNWGNAFQITSSLSGLPPNRRAYVSGDARPGELSAATTDTLNSLEATLKHLAADRKQIVQLKAFFKPMSEAAKVRSAITAFFSDSPVPPVVLVEWTMPGPIEIELIAMLPERAEGTAASAIRYVTPPGMKASPVFSRVVVVDHPSTIYVSGLYGPDEKDAVGQVRKIFTQLDSLLHKSGSDLRHLAKATYYVSDDGASDALNKLRPEYYDPARPPAASKASVAGTGVPGTTVTLDMIAIPAAAP